MKPSERGPRNLILLADSSPGYSCRVDTTIGMAVKFDAFLTGVFLQEQNHLLHDDAMRQLPDSFRQTVQSNRDRLDDKAAIDAENIFWSKIDSVQWRDKAQWKRINGSPDHVAATISRYADLVIGGQNPSTRNQDYTVVDPGNVVVKSGRPIFVVPQKFTPKGYTSHALLCWDGSGEAARALSDAMLILGPETKMTILTVDTKDIVTKDFGFDLEYRLKSRGISSKRVTISKNFRDCGKELISYAQKIEADLIIMGAYRHSPLRQSVIGGATKSVLKNMQIPIFLSH